jgi:undecaprenyl-phosphate galactose phosphotransferase
MKENMARLILLCIDVLVILISIVSAYYTRQLFSPLLGIESETLAYYTHQYIVYVFVIVAFWGLHIYKYRHDFWEETYLLGKALLIALVLILSVLVLTKSSEKYSRFIIVLAFVYMGLLIPIFKYIFKKKFFVFGLWGKPAEVLSKDSNIIQEIFTNRYLGYIQESHKKSQTVFLDTNSKSIEKIEGKLSEYLYEKKEVIFIPVLKSFNYANTAMLEVFNARTNLVILENSLLKPSNIFIKRIFDACLVLLSFPFLLFIFTIVIYKMKKEEPNGSIFFKQERIGLNGKTFICYKFRSMFEDGEKILETYLQENPQEIENYNIYHKYENDPRITKIGAFLRKTSLDELPQIINIVKGEMSFIGPRPYMLNEQEKIGSKIDMVLAVKPGITGLWQVSGRSNIDFNSRVDIDVYYTRNWNLWMDLAIFCKTIKVVLFREGAY